MKQALTLLLLVAAGSLARPAFSQDVPTTGAVASANAGDPNAQVVAQFDTDVQNFLLDRGIGMFNTPDPNTQLTKLPTLRPFRASVGGPFGDLYGITELYFGFTTTGTGTGDFPDLESVTTLNYGDHFRGHIQANILKVPFNTVLKRQAGLPEVYAEVHTESTMPAGPGPLGGASYFLSGRIGKVAQLLFPSLDPLTLSDRLPGFDYAFTGLSLQGEVDATNGFGGHMGYYHRMGSRGTLGESFISDAYGLYRHRQKTSPLFFEGRLGWLPRTVEFFPVNAGLGVEGYAGYHSGFYSAGGFVSKIFKQGVIFGGVVTLARNSLTELFGLAPSKLITSGTGGGVGFGAQIMLAQAYLGATSHVEEGEPIIGQADEIRTWNNGTGIGVGTTDTTPVARWGTRTGKNVRRIVNVTPWWLYEDSLMKVPHGAAGGRAPSEVENYSHNRSDVQYTYYQVIPVAHFTLQITAVDAATNKPINKAQLSVLLPAAGAARLGSTSAKGTATFKYRLKPGETATVHIAGTADNHLPAAMDVPLAPNVVNRVTLQFPPLLGTLRGIVTVAVDNTPISDAEVILVPATGNPVVHTTGPDGSYEFHDIIPGDYELRLHKPGYDDQSQKLTIKGGETRPVNFQTRAQRGGIVGRVVDANGDAISGATVTILNAAGVTLVTRTTGTGGTFAERVEPGSYTVNVTAPGYANGSSMVTVPPGQPANITITLQKQ